MKRLLSVLIASSLTLASFAVCGAEDITVTLDGNQINFDVPPQIIDDFTFVPMRAIFEALGANVTWDESTRTVASTRGNTEIIMTIDSGDMLVNNDVITLEAPPRIIDGRTLVPVRAVAESFDCTVEWNGDTRAVTITSAPEVTLETPVPTSEPAAEIESGFPVLYDDTNEFKSSLAKNFVLTSVTTNSDGNYEITFTVNTYRESSGDVLVTYNCYDSEDIIVDKISKKYFAYAYNWTPQNDSAVISGKTAVIRLAENE